MGEKFIHSKVKTKEKNLFTCETLKNHNIIFFLDDWVPFVNRDGLSAIEKEEKYFWW